MLEVEKLTSGYGMVQILWDVSFKIKEKEIVCIIGPNGAGKTTLVKTIVGLLPAKSGAIRFKGENIEKLPPYEIVKRGVTLIPEGREIFPRMTVDENLRLGAYTIKDKEEVNKSKDKVDQNIRDSLNIANRAYVLEEGKIIIEGEGRELLSNDHIKEVYLGV